MTLTLNSIVYRVVIPMVIGTVVAGILLLWIVPDRQNAALEESVKSELQSLSAAFAVSAELAFAQEDLRALSQLNKLLSDDRRGLRVAVFLGSQGDEELLAAFPDEDSSYDYLHESSADLLKASSPFYTELDSGRVVVLFDKANLRAQTTRLNLPLYFALLVLVLIQLAIYSRLTRDVVAPIISAAQLADELGSGQLNQQLPKETRQDEVGILQSALRVLRTRLKLARRRNQRLMDSLESEVDKRTKDLQRALTAKDTFMAGISHELRTPLHSVIASLDLIATDEQIQPNQEKNVHLARRGARALMQLINELLEFQRLSQTDVELQPEPQQVSRLVCDVIDIADALFQQSALSFIPKITVDEDYWGDFDGHRVTQVLLNLIGNARKFTEQGCVTLEVHAQSHNDDTLLRLNFTVADTGRGMDQGTLVRLGEAFFQGDDKLSRRHQGTGLGLSIVKRILAAMGSELQVTSQLGKGSQFTFCLTVPRHHHSPSTPENSVTESRLSSAEAVSPIAPLSVLYVEDSEMNQMMMAALCERFPVTLTVSNSAKTGYSLIQTQRFDLIITDIQMPEHSGLDLLAWFQKDPGANAGVSLFACTATATRQACDMFQAAGFAGVLTKPLTLDELATFFNQQSVTFGEDQRRWPRSPTDDV